MRFGGIPVGMVLAFKGDRSLTEGLAWQSVCLQKGMCWLKRGRMQLCFTCFEWSGELLSGGDTKSKGEASEICGPWWIMFGAVLLIVLWSACFICPYNTDKEPRLGESNLSNVTHLVRSTALYSSQLLCYMGAPNQNSQSNVEGSVGGRAFQEEERVSWMHGSRKAHGGIRECQSILSDLKSNGHL